MKSSLPFALLASAAFAAETAPASWNVWLSPEDSAKYTLDSAAFYSGAGAHELSIQQGPTSWWNLQIQAPSFDSDSAYYQVSFKAKGLGAIIAVVQKGSADGKAVAPLCDLAQYESATFKLTDNWETHSFTALVPQKGKAEVAFQLGLVTGNVAVDSVVVTSANAPDESWFKSADARIDSLRKKNLTLNVKPGEKVKVELVQHEFPFGTAVGFWDDPRKSKEKKYFNYAKKYFWSMVPENMFKWPEYEPKKGEIRRDWFKPYPELAKENDWSIRAHTLIWGIQLYNYDKHFGNNGTCEEISANMKERITRDVSEYKGVIDEFDVWNEVFHEPYLTKKCGWGLVDSAFVWAHNANPEAKLYINEFNVLSGGETDYYYDFVKGMLDRGVPVSGIGVQCHYGHRNVIPEFMKERLDKLGSLGLPIKVTELDIGTWDEGIKMSEKEQAHRYEMILRSAFSHPAVAGIMMWGFMDGRHWIKDGGIIAANGREKPAAKTIYNLWHKTWTTKGTFKADENGLVKFRGFPGKYKVTAGGKTQIVVLN